MSGRSTIERLRAAGCVFAEREAALLEGEATTPSGLERILRERESGRPLEQVVGWAQFRGRRVAVDPGVFVPRRRTEFLVDLAIGFVEPRAVIVDLCCGSAAIGAAIAAETRAGTIVEVYAADIDHVAVGCARRNLPSASVFEGDLFEALPPHLRGRITVLAVNAPYVPTDAIRLMPPEARDHEALVSLDGGTDGLDVHRRIAAGAAVWLADGGRVLIETSERQASRTAALLRESRLSTTVERDDERDATVVIGKL